MRASGVRTTIPAQSRPTAATGVMAVTRFRVRPLRRPSDKSWPIRWRSKLHARRVSPDPPPPKSNARQMFPGPRLPKSNVPRPSAGWNRTARSSACKVRKIREITAIVASRACSRSPVLHRCRGQHPPVAVVAVAAEAVMVVAGTNFLFLCFSKMYYPSSRAYLPAGVRRHWPCWAWGSHCRFVV